MIVTGLETKAAGCYTLAMVAGRRSNPVSLAVFLVATTLMCGGVGGTEAPLRVRSARGDAIDVTREPLAAQPSDIVHIRGGSFYRGAGPFEIQLAIQLCLTRTRLGVDNELRCSNALFELEAPRRSIHVDEFGMDRFEVSNARYRRCVRAGACLPAATSADDPRIGRPEHPVSGVSFADAEAYCEFAGGRLPTESEWERAAAGTSGQRRFPWGRQYNDRLSNHGDDGRPDPVDGYRHAAPVDAFPQSASPDGLLNMAGNVWEWTADRFAPEAYGSGPSVNPTGPRSGGERVVRGGSWRSDPHALRVTHRVPVAEGTRFPDLGFRCAYDIDVAPRSVR